MVGGRSLDEEATSGSTLGARASGPRSSPQAAEVYHGRGLCHGLVDCSSCARRSQVDGQLAPPTSYRRAAV